MSCSDHELVSKLFLAARSLHRSDREVFLDRACHGNKELRHEVETLLKNDDPDDGFLEKPVIDSKSIKGHPVPEHIGEYKILRFLGEGGMGIVYLAEQRNPRRRVALKVMLSAWASPRMLKRFEHEAQVLARLHHPGIAQIFEAAIADSPAGPQPYFAMEFVEGQTITEFARARSLPVRDRLALMIRVCEAVQHAHQNGVIHRDLKPGNILVVGEGAEGSRGQGAEERQIETSALVPRTLGPSTPSAAQPKILDFGVARASDNDDLQTTLRTQTGELVGTLPYMSPEQFEGKPAEVDTRSDIYSLGLILYELFADRPAHDLNRCNLSDAARIIREQEPVPLGSIDRSFRGDIENIVAKAIEKDRQRRYQSAGEMAADIQRYLDDEPILARATSRIYRFRKFARRNRAFVAVVSFALMALSAGMIAAMWQAVRAQREAQRVEKVNHFLRRMFVAIDPHMHGQEVRVLDVVKRAESEIAPTFESEPLLEAAVREEVAAIYVRLGALSDAERHYVAARDIRRRELGRTHPDFLTSVSDLGVVRSKQARHAEAEPLLRAAHEGRRAALGPEHPDTLTAMTDLATTLHALNRHEEAESLCRAALEIQSRIHGDDHLHTLTTTANLATILQARGRSEESEALHHRAAKGLSQHFGPNHPTTLLSVANLARLLKGQKRYDAAEPLQRRVVEGFVERLGERHPDTLIARANLAMMLWRQNKLSEAEVLYRTARDDFAVVFGHDHGHVMTVTIQLALVLERQEKYSEAATLLDAAVEGYRRLFGVEHPRTKQVDEHIKRIRKKTRSS
ncbi:MAG: serine/threonine-protein kinase [Phycisphaerales bacterium]|nr:serine/threonine-protein kinase [Phycisphaerales bacterium]